MFDSATQGDASRSVTAQLQELFAEMQLSAQRAVFTSRLTKSFGWDGDQSFQQNDVHECMAVLLDAVQRQAVIDFGDTDHAIDCLCLEDAE